MSKALFQHNLYMRVGIATVEVFNTTNYPNPRSTGMPRLSASATTASSLSLASAGVHSHKSEDRGRKRKAKGQPMRRRQANRADGGKAQFDFPQFDSVSIEDDARADPPCLYL